jgi:hypothetical protein
MLPDIAPKPPTGKPVLVVSATPRREAPCRVLFQRSHDRPHPDRRAASCEIATDKYSVRLR